MIAKGSDKQKSLNYQYFIMNVKNSKKNLKNH